MDGSKDGTKRATVRANQHQTVILKGAFTQSNVVSPEELKTLSEKTGLPEKWIHLWFARQRAKVRKTNPVDPGPVTSSSDPVLSQQEILEVKMEYRDSLIPRSPSLAITTASVIGPASDANVSQYEKAPLKKRTRVSQPRFKQKETAVQRNLIKPEHIDRVANAPGDSASMAPSMAQNATSCNNSQTPQLNEGPLMAQPIFPFSRIAPPSRTPLKTNVLAHPYPGDDRKSGLSSNQSYRIYSPHSASDVTTVNIANSQPFKSTKAAVYQQGPRFHTHFYNNGPANYRNTRSNIGVVPEHYSSSVPLPIQGSYLAESMLPVSDVSGRQNIPKQVGLGAYFSQSFAPAIVLENTSKTTPPLVAPMNNYSVHSSSSSVQYVESNTITEGLPYLPYCSTRQSHEEDGLGVNPEDIVISTQYNLLISRMEASQAFPTFYNEALDPSLAPLKHLTDILGRFRDRDGTYTKLVDLQEREGLLACLLDDELARRNPFKAAMGLILLSKLGLEWDYMPVMSSNL